MHLVFLNQYYPPDAAPTGLMLHAVAERLCEDGHMVTVLCASGGYAATAGSDAKPEIAGGGEREENGKHRTVRVVRIGATRFGRGTFLGKLADYVSFYAGVKWKLMTMQPRPDRVVALTTPPYLSVLARGFSKLRGADHAHWVMDLYPDVMVAHGMISADGLVAGGLRRLARWGMGGERSRMVLTLGPDMEERVAHYLSDDTPRSWVPLWGTAAAEEVKPGPPDEAGDRGGRVVLMYSGNMGLGHRFDEFLQAAESAGDDFQWKFHGEGKRRVEIENFVETHPDAPVTVGGYVPLEDLPRHLASADVHLASLEESWDGTMVPSKLQGIFAVGKPVIFVGSASCSIGRWILESGGGWVVAPNDPGQLRDALDEARDETLRQEKGSKALAYSRRHFDARINSRKIADLLT